MIQTKLTSCLKSLICIFLLITASACSGEGKRHLGDTAVFQHNDCYFAVRTYSVDALLKSRDILYLVMLCNSEYTADPSLPSYDVHTLFRLNSRKYSVQLVDDTVRTEYCPDVNKSLKHIRTELERFLHLASIDIDIKLVASDKVC